jgi:adenylyltransferase/sulfurtransferase
MPYIKIPTPLRPYTASQSEIQVEANNIDEALLDLVRQYPGLEKHLFAEDGQLRPYVNLFLDEEDIRHLQGGDTQLTEDDRVLIIPSIAGGSAFFRPG